MNALGLFARTKFAMLWRLMKPEVRLQKFKSVMMMLAFAAMTLAAGRPTMAAGAALSGAPLTAKYRSVSILGQGEDVQFLFEAPVNGASSTSVVELLRTAVQAGDISESEAEQIFVELSDLTGARYKLPETRREIMSSLGFPDGTVMLATNWFEMAAVHLETSLSISALSSRFMLHALGVKANVAPVDAGVAEAVAEVDAASTMSVTIPPISEAGLAMATETSTMRFEPEEKPEAKFESEPVVVEADRNPLPLEAAPQGGDFMAKPALK